MFRYIHVYMYVTCIIVVLSTLCLFWYLYEFNTFLQYIIFSIINFWPVYLSTFMLILIFVHTFYVALKRSLFITFHFEMFYDV